MPDDNMLNKWQQSLLYGSNASWVEALYETYLSDPNSVDSRWRNYFEILPAVNHHVITDTPHSEIRARYKNIAYRKQAIPTGTASSQQTIPDSVLDHERKQVKVLQLINAYRFRGHQKAKLNPLAQYEETQIPELELNHYGFTNSDYNTLFDTGSLVGVERATLDTIFKRLQEIYCGSIGAEYMHITETDEKRWLQQQFESTNGKLTLHTKEKLRILRRLTAAEGLEKYLHSKYVGQKRFSLEGGESLIVLLDELIQRSGMHGVKECVIGMAHRGRLNVLVNIIGKTPAELFAEFEGRHGKSEYSGDVKYHMGFSSDVQTPGGPMHLTLSFNPSHLEISAPVVEGSVRARQERRGDKCGDLIIPIQIHGDAAFAGQGVVMETFQMSQTRGYSTKGTVHIVVNNQIGFTTSTTSDARSTQYCSDVAKIVGAPIIHVNADDPEAVIFATQIALDYRVTFKKDVVIDLVCYRRHGHNEADEPSATQPVMYQRIKALPTTRTLYTRQLIEELTLDDNQADEMVENFRSELDAGHSVMPHLLSREEVDYPFAFHWEKYIGNRYSDDANTAISLELLRDLAHRLEQMPQEF